MSADHTADHFPDLRKLLRAHLAAFGGDREAAARRLPWPAAVTETPDATVAHAPGVGPTVPEAVPTGGLRYRVERLLARGGLGEVHVAQDAELPRQVAYKRMRPDKADSAALARLFLREARVTGRLEHPGVVPVYGLGVEADGQPYYAMRLIAGTDMQAAIDALHAAPADYRGSAFRRLLGRFVAVCQAVDFAHSRGVIHRDLKPANVMLGDFGESLVVDWGLGRLFREPEEADEAVPEAPDDGRDGDLSRAGDLKGTVVYMAPEQAAGDPDLGPACDIYALGGVLYTLLTGRTQAHGSTVMQYLDRLANAIPPVAPRSLAPRCPRGLEAACLKALAHDPADRYASAGELAADVERWLADEPVSARRDPLPARLARAARKRPGVSAGLGATLAVGALAAALSVSVLSGKNRELAAAAELANRRLETAQAAVKTFLSEVTKDADLNRADFRPLRKRLLLTAVPFLEGLTGHEPADAAQALAQAEAVFRLAYLHAEAGDAAAARTHYARCGDLYAALAERDPAETIYRVELAKMRNNVGNLLLGERRFGEAQASFAECQTLLSALCAEQPANAEFALLLAMSHESLGYRAEIVKEWDECRRQFAAALGVHSRLTSERPEDARHPLAAARCRVALGFAHRRAGELAQAAEHLGAAVATLTGVLEREPASAEALDPLARALLALGRHAEAVEARVRLVRAHPSVPRYGADLAALARHLAGPARVADPAGVAAALDAAHRTLAEMSRAAGGEAFARPALELLAARDALLIAHGTVLETLPAPRPAGR